MSSGVEFEEDKFGLARPTASPVNRFNQPNNFNQVPNIYDPSANQTGMVRWLMRHNIAGSPRTANIALSLFIVFNIIVTIIVYKFFISQ